MKEKLNQMNEVIANVVKSLDDKTLLVVIGDHGMDSTGNHGGDSPDELESTLFMYAKNNKFFKKDSSHYNTTEQGKHYRAVNQIDLVSTMSLLLGLPIPFNNLGFPIDEAFENQMELSVASYKTLQQIQGFRNSTPNLSPEINKQYHQIISNYTNNSHDLYTLVDLAKTYQSLSLIHI